MVTNRHPLDEFKLSGLDPFVSEVVTPSEESLYLKGQADDYPTALLDPDGNERASVYLRNSDFNALHILLREINRPGVDPAIRRDAIAEFCHVIDRHRNEWSATVRELSEELAALRRAMEQRRAEIQSQPKKWTPEQRDAGLDKAARRLAVELDSWREQEHNYSAYLRALSTLLDLEPAEFDRRHLTAADLIPKRAMGDANSVYDLENYIVGPSPANPLDFERINYPKLLVEPHGSQQRAARRLVASRGFHRHASSRSTPSGFMPTKIIKRSDRNPVKTSCATQHPESAPGRRRRHSL